MTSSIDQFKQAIASAGLPPPDVMLDPAEDSKTLLDAFVAAQFDTIPIELRKLPKWVAWRAEGQPGEKPAKVPYAPDRPNTRASTADPQTWGSFEQAEAAYLEGERTGVGIVLDGDGLVGVDIDHCVVDGVPDPVALTLLDNLGAAYVELSPSGTGLRAFGYADGLTRGCKGKYDGLDIELYSTGRYLTVTGRSIKTGPMAALRGFAELADYIRADRKVNPDTGQVIQAAPDERHAELVQRVLSGDVYHDSLRDLAASLVATGMHAGAAVTHLRGLMDNSAAPHDDRWVARRKQIPDLVSSACAKFLPGPDSDSSALKMNMIEAMTGELVPATPTSDEPQDVSIADLATFAASPPEFWAEEILPADVVTLLGAHGGVGKTMLALIAGVCLAMGLPFLGKQTKPANVLFYSAEDDSDMLRWRLAMVCQRLGVDPVALSERLVVIDASAADPVLYVEASRNGVRIGEPTAAFRKLKARMAAHGSQIVILDNASDVYGADENNRGQVRAFIRLLAKLVRDARGAVLLLAHVDKLTARQGGSEGYSGSTAWHNSVRSRLFLSAQPPGGLLLEHQKSNRGQKASPMHLVWDDGMPMLAGGATTAGCALVENILKASAKAQDDTDKVALIAVIQRFDKRQERVTTACQGSSTVYKLLKADPDFPKATGPDRLIRLLRELQDEGRIYRRTVKTPDRKRREVFTCVPEPEGAPIAEVPPVSEGDDQDFVCTD